MKSDKKNAKFTPVQKNFIIIFSVICIIILIVSISVIFSDLTRPKADYAGFKTAMSKYLKTNSDIKEIKIDDRTSFTVSVSDKWYNSSEIEKLRFCKSVHNSIYAYADRYNLTYDGNKFVFVDFYDTAGIQVAEQDMTDYKILH